MHFAVIPLDVEVAFDNIFSHAGKPTGELQPEKLVHCACQQDRFALIDETILLNTSAGGPTASRR